MTAFLALYRGETVSGARLVALTADPTLVKDFAARLIADDPHPEDCGQPDLRLLGRGQDESVKKGRAANSPRHQTPHPGGFPHDTKG
jgi:hypothetical protein